MNRALEADNVTKRYNKVVALQGVSFSVRRGEVFGLLGPNGAGKTTMANILSTHLLPTSGTTRVMGRDCVAEARQVRTLVGVAPSNPRSLYWRLTGRENLMRFAFLYGLDARTAGRRASELLERFGLREAGNRFVGEYSTGMRAKLILARAMIHDPPVLILDEPWATLDPEARIDLTGLLREVAVGEQKTILVCSHDLPLVEKVCDRVAVIDKGTVICSGKTSELLASLPYQYVIHLGPFPDMGRTKAVAATLGARLEHPPQVTGRRVIRLKVTDLITLFRVLDDMRLGREVGISVRSVTLEDVYLSRRRQAEGTQSGDVDKGEEGPVIRQTIV